MSGWVSCTIGDQITLQRGVDITKKDCRDGTVPIISSGGISAYHDTPIDTGPGVVIGRKGTLGTVYWASGPYWPHDTTLYVKDFKGNDRRYIFYFLRTIDTKTLDVGSSNPTLNRNHVHQLPVIWPPLSEQREIAAALGALDDKIELNRKTVATLEAMARALYRSWFVDFDPVHAKSEGRPPAHMDPTTAALFPDSFGEDGLPVGWRQDLVGKFFSFQRGLSYKGEFLTEHGSPMINLGCFLGSGNFDHSKIKNYSGPAKERNYVRVGDLVLANTDMTQNRVILGSPHIVEHGPSLYSHHVFAGRSMKGEPENWERFFYFLFLQPEFRERAEGFASGTTVLFLPSDAIEAQEFPLPPLEIWRAFLGQVQPWLDRKSALEKENQTLATLRDTLLPRLMSGDLRVGEAREQMEAVA